MPYSAMPECKRKLDCYQNSESMGSRNQQFDTSSFEKTYKCNLCDYASVHGRNLRRHLKTLWRKGVQMQPVQVHIFFCSSFEGSYMRGHSGEKSYKCNQCEFASAWTGSLRKHLKTHSGEIHRNQCTMCLSQFYHFCPFYH